MNIKEQVIKESIKRIDKRINKLNDILNTQCVINIIEIREKAQKVIRTEKDPIKLIKTIKELERQEGKEFEKYEDYRKNFIKYADEVADLERQKMELHQELRIMKLKK